MNLPSDPISVRGWYATGFKDAIGLPALLIMATMCGVGGLVRDIGYPVWAGTLSTLLIWAGPAQVILFGAVAAGASLPATAFAIWLSSSRFLPMTVSILPLVRQPDTGGGATCLAAHLVSMTTWVEGLRRLPALPKEGRMGYFLGYATVIISCGILATHAGFYIYALVPKVVAAGLLFTTPLFFSAAMVAGARSVADWTALGFGFFVTPLAVMVLPSGMDFLAIGLVGGTLAFLIHRRMRAQA